MKEIKLDCGCITFKPSIWDHFLNKVVYIPPIDCEKHKAERQLMFEEYMVFHFANEEIKKKRLRESAQKEEEYKAKLADRIAEKIKELETK